MFKIARRALLLTATTCIMAACSSSKPTLKPQAAKHSPNRIAHQAPMPPYVLPEPTLRTVEDILYGYGPSVDKQLEPFFRKAGIQYPPREITLIGLKAERKLELWAGDGRGRQRYIRSYDVRAASGDAGPKLRQGDRQVPEGVYRITGLNPNSNYHLSMRLNYPNDFDRFHAEREGRTDPGGDIFIHGNEVSAGCLAMGDGAIEELFVLVAKVGEINTKVIITPRDGRILPLNGMDPTLPEWTVDLYDMINRELAGYSPAVAVSSTRASSMAARSVPATPPTPKP